jgi:hypothetical protein
VSGVNYFSQAAANVLVTLGDYRRGIHIGSILLSCSRNDAREIGTVAFRIANEVSVTNQRNLHSTRSASAPQQPHIVHAEPKRNRPTLTGYNVIRDSIRSLGGRHICYSVLRNTMSAALSSGLRFSPNSCPFTARDFTPTGMKPLGT